jgi:PEP-CTERM motif-containing protein
MAYSQRMARLSIVATAAIVALTLALATPAVAFPIMYVFTGTGTGLARALEGTTSFTNADFEVSIIVDTETTINGFPIFNSGGGTVSISGVGSFDLLYALEVSVNNFTDIIGFGGVFYLSNLPSLTSMDYDLVSVYPRETGLVTCCPGFSAGNTIWTKVETPGSFQAINFSAFGSTGTFEAIVEGVPNPPLSPIPEPGTLSLLALGLGSVGVRRLRPLFQRRVT